MLKVMSLVLVAGAAHAAHFDPPDLNLEYQLHRAFSETAKTQADPSEGWIENYRLQAGENLWNLSQMLYGDGSYWPKVWAQNRSITNPHLVRKGHTLELLLGSEDQAPSFRFSEEGDSGIELAAATVSNPQIEVPPPEIPPRPLIRIPKSFPPWQDVYRKLPDEIGLDDSRIRSLYVNLPDRIVLSGYAQDNKIESYGKFLENEKESGLPVAMQYVYVKIKKGLGHEGQKLLIVKDHGRIAKMNSQVDGRISAHFIEVFGDLQLVEAAQSVTKRGRQKDFDIFRALILHANSLSLTDFDLVPGEMQSVDLSANGPSGTTTAQIVGSAKLKNSALYGPGDIVFLNRGSRDGVVEGQILDVFIDRSIRNSRATVDFSSMPSGSVKVVRVDGGCSTGVVLRSVDGILQGDRLQQRADNTPASAPGDAVNDSMSSDEFSIPEAPADNAAPPASGDDFNLPE